jgi:hypothetical protein
MNSFDKLRENWGASQLRHAMARMEEVHKQHGVKLYTPSNTVPLLMLAGIAMFVGLGLENEQVLSDAVKAISNDCGVPEEAVCAYADLVKAMYSAQLMGQRTSPFVGGDDE